eukprot:COSAG05_NODE_156_length_15696_cov_359.955440_12_plen_47_part_00
MFPPEQAALIYPYLTPDDKSMYRHMIKMIILTVISPIFKTRAQLHG